MCTQISDNPDVINAAKREMEKDSEEVPLKCSGEFNGGYIRVYNNKEFSKKVEKKLLSLGYKIAYGGKGYCDHSFFSPNIWVNNYEFHSTAGTRPKDLKEFIMDNKELSWKNPSIVDRHFKQKSDAKIEELKEKYATGKYDCYYTRENLNSEWNKRSSNCIEFETFNTYKLILKEHSHIADAVIDDPDVEVYQADGALLCDFFDEYMPTMTYKLRFEKEAFTVTERSNFSHRVYHITDALAEMLISKNAKYGNSALEPKRIFSKASAVEQILVRIDDKLSRMSNQDGLEDEDVVEDLLGYLVLLKIAKEKV